MNVRHNRSDRVRLLTIAIGLLAGFSAVAQQQPLPGTPPVDPSSPPPPQMADTVRPNYTLGPDDQILIRAFQVEELRERPVRVESDGTINIPLLGLIKVSGMTLQELEADLTKRLGVYVRSPQVNVTITQFRSEPVFFIGAFRSPGIYALQGRHTLIEMLSRIGGLQPNASRRIKIARRAESGVIPLPNAVRDEKGSWVEISMGSLRENVNPAEDIVLQPYDTITVERAEMIYVTGEVARIGALELGERESLSVLQAMALSGGLRPNAVPHKARVLRPIHGTTRRAEIPIDLTRIMDGKQNDYPLLPNDVLFVPKSSTRAVLARVGLAAVPVATGFLIWAIRR